MSERTLLGFDYGRKRIGVAVGQEITATAKGLTTLQHSGKPDWAVIDRLIADWRPHVLIVGLPLNLDAENENVPHPLQAEVKAFGVQLAQRYNLPVEWMDERLSSIEAETQLANSGRKKHQKRDKAEIDRLAAQLILESYLNRHL